MKRTINIMTTARAKGAELPAEWWLHCKCCVQCGSPLFPHDGYFCEKEGCVAQFKSATSFTPGERYIGPDLELPENLHHAFMVADAISDFDVDIMADCEPGPQHFSVTMYLNSNEETGDCDINRGYGPQRHLAIVAACEAALGIQHEKEIAT